MARNWTSRITRRTRKWGDLFRTQPRPRGSAEIDADVRRMRVELDAIRSRFPDHA